MLICVGCREQCYYSKDPLNPIKLVSTDVSHSICQDETNLKKLLNGDFATGDRNLFTEINRVATVPTATYNYRDLTTNEHEELVGRVTNFGSEGQQFKCTKIQMLIDVTWKQTGVAERVETFEDGDQKVCMVEELNVSPTEVTHIDLGDFLQHMIPLVMAEEEGDL
jgi:hypothetical protein